MLVSGGRALIAASLGALALSSDDLLAATSFEQATTIS